MDQRFQTSLIPKRPENEGRSLSQARKPGTWFYWVSVFIFFAAIFAAAGLFGYERYLLSQIAQKKQLIDVEVKAFDKQLTETLTVAKERIDAGEEIISNHLAVSLFFNLLEDLTARGVYFSEFDFKTPEEGPVAFIAQGEAPSYAVLAFQSDVLKDSEYIIRPQFSEINLNEKGRIDFKLTAEMDSRSILYKTAVPSSGNSDNSNSTSTEEGQ